jgi:hypothetical protein
VNSIINYFEKYSDNLFVIQIWLLVIILATFVWVWYYNRKKYNHLKHQIPASVVKNYLDSIIQNSTALKSSLFRGGGLDVDPDSVPSVMPLSDLPGGTTVNLDSGDGDAALKAQVAKLQSQVVDQKNVIKDLESSNHSFEDDIKIKQERIKELEAMLANASSGDETVGVVDPEVQNKLDAMIIERDELAENLKQYDIISGDLADLKKLKQENEQLRRALAESGKSIPEMKEVVEDTVEDADTIVDELDNALEEFGSDSDDQEEKLEEFSSGLSDEPAPFAEDASEDEEVVEAAEPSPIEEEDDEEEESSPEDLLSEFEKMLK